ncbi:MAG TPA: iron-containing redox enzyme family protein [Candidatus Binatia bacterium]|nr:iron-containing redox enzyme family protein [Candidatus Binatia bacterium]
MALTTERFASELSSEIRARRSFGGHPFWHEIEQGAVSRKALQTFAKQFYLQVFAFPRAVSALHSRCADAGERIRLAESLYEEETGRISGVDKPHPEVFLDFCTAIGLSRDEVIGAPALASTAALIHWFEYSTKILTFLEGVAAINLAAEGQVVGAFGPFARALERHYGCSASAVAFWDVHELADAEHSDVGDHIVIRHALTDEVQEGVRRAVRTSLGMWWQFFSGIEQEARAQ